MIKSIVAAVWLTGFSWVQEGADPNSVYVAIDPIATGSCLFDTDQLVSQLSWRLETGRTGTELDSKGHQVSAGRWLVEPPPEDSPYWLVRIEASLEPSGCLVSVMTQMRIDDDTLPPGMHISSEASSKPYAFSTPDTPRLAEYAAERVGLAMMFTEAHLDR